MSLLHPKTRSLLLTSVLALAAIVPASRATAAEYQVLHDFPSGQNDGADPYADVIFKHGNLYGTTAKGGGNSNAGTVFRIAPDGSETVLYSFSGKADGNYPYGITLDRSTGDIYGVTGEGGVVNHNCLSGCGVIYQLTREGSFTVLHSFTYSDGKIPVGRLIRDAQGNFYGVTTSGGSRGYGTIFKLAANGSFSVLYQFTGGNDGGNPHDALDHDGAGNLYGTAFGGVHEFGVVFRLAPDGSYKVLHSFAGGSDGAYPIGGIEHDRFGNLYGTTETGGSKDAGTIFMLTSAGAFSSLYSFTSGADGKYPWGNMLKVGGALYGTTSAGGAGYGTVFKILADGTFTTVHTFDNQGGAGPYVGLTKNKDGILYGTTFAGGANGWGTVFSITKK